MAKPSRKKIWLALAGLIAAADLLVWLAVYHEAGRERMLEVDFFDVGQGDSSLIMAPNGSDILIDGGPDSSILADLGATLPFWDRDIDLIVLTHPDHDHIAGLLEVLKNYNVKNILWTGAVKDSAEFDEWRNLIAAENANIAIAKSGETISFDADPGHYLQVLYPAGDISGEVAKDSNNTSVVLKLVYGDRSFLFTGDIGKEIEGSLAEGGGDLKADVLKFPHHGSKYSAVDEFIEAVRPEAAVISVGAGNSYGHPGEATLEMLAKYGINIFRTDADGDIVFETDGKKLYKK